MTLAKQILILTGSTAVGKTEYALEWASAHRAEIISCDSLLVYRNMNIGTAKPNSDQLRRVWHHGIDVVPVAQQFNVSDYLDLSQKVVKAILDRGHRILVTGGSGFYLKSFLAPVIDGVEIPKSINETVDHLLEEKGLQSLLDRLHLLNPGGLGDLDINNPRRVANALKRCLANNKTHLQLVEAFKSQPTPFDDYEVITCQLTRPRDELAVRIKQRVHQMIDDGLITEVQQLLEEGILENPSACRAIGYEETIRWLKDPEEKTIENLVEEIALNTGKLAAKQRKWFRHQIHFDHMIDLSKTSLKEFASWDPFLAQ